MHDSKLFHIVNTFTKGEWNKAQKILFIESEKESEAHQLYGYISKYRHSLNAKQLNIEYAHQKLFPQKTRKGFQNVMSKLALILEDYLRWDWLKNNRDENDLSLLFAYNNRGLFHLYNLKSDQVIQKLNSPVKISLWNDLNLLRIIHTQTFSDNPKAQDNSKESMRSATLSLVNFTASLSNYYLSAMFHQTKIIPEAFKDEIDLLSMFPSSESNGELHYYMKHLQLLILKGIPQSYDILYHAIIDVKKIFSNDLNKAIFMSLLQYATNEFKEGSVNTPEKIMNLYDYGIKSKILMVNNIIPHRRFVNIVNVMCACHKFMEARKFIDSFGDLLIEDYRDGAIHISLAQIAFYEKNYGGVITMLSTRNFQKFIHTTRMRWLLLCCYYKEYRDDFEFMNSAIRNFNNYIKNNRNKLSESSYTGSLNLSKIIKYLVTKKSKKFLENELARNKNIVFRSWLKELSDSLQD